MFHKTETNYKRTVRTYLGSNYRKDERHTERVLCETWWFLCIPLWSRVSIQATNI